MTQLNTEIHSSLRVTPAMEDSEVTAMVEIDPDDLLVLVRACMEYEIDGRACRSAMNTFRLNPTTKPQFAQYYGEFYRTERSSFEPVAKRKYAPIVEAIEHGDRVGDALKQVASQMRH